MDNNPHPSFPDDRSPLAFFEGRKWELANLRDRTMATLETGGAGVKGIQLVTGVPGAGKTALGMHFGESMNDPRVAFAYVSVETLNSAEGLFAAITDAVGSSRADVQGKADVSAKVSVDITGIGKGEMSGGRKASGEAGSRGLDTILRQSKDLKLWNDKAVVLIIDELQTAKESHSETLRTLHYGTHGCPIMVVGIGLQHTPNILSSLGISRVSRPMILHSLDREAARDVFMMNADFYAGVTAIPDPFMDQLLEASHCFPQHIHGYLEGIVDAATEHGTNAIGRGSIQRGILERGNQCRIAYYGDRLDAMAREIVGPERPLGILLNEMGKRNGSLKDYEAVEVLNEAGHDGDKVVDAATRHGVLRLKDRRYDFGIPSFHSYMQNLCAKDLAREAAPIVR